MAGSASHEDFSRDEGARIGSERGFGVVFATVFAVVGVWPLISGGMPRWWALVVAAILLAAAFLIPRLLRPLNVVWFRFGLLLYKVVNPVVMALLFYATVVPTGLAMRLFGKDPLNRRFDPTAETYWTARNPVGPTPESMKNQF